MIEAFDVECFDAAIFFLVIFQIQDLRECVL